MWFKPLACSPRPTFMRVIFFSSLFSCDRPLLAAFGLLAAPATAFEPALRMLRHSQQAASTFHYQAHAAGRAGNHPRSVLDVAGV
ncbi:hypothetical protein Pla111_17110 [Botrimarina hoheduenensis]|uniref:Uncharacterized protein n=1 Tax=Botrimarina hoheduenensis TaxID=2528000 RepID=A0A5C5W8U7_9BACT|nr:hypothetical protein Pla111_17110 [Botrimarina hoheduenensis]